MRLWRKVILGLFGSVILTAAVTTAAVACAGQNAPDPYSDVSYGTPKMETAQGIFAQDAGTALQDQNQQTLVSELSVTYPNLGITNPNASITKILYTPGTRANAFNNGTLKIWLVNYDSPNSNAGLAVQINGIAAFHTPLPAVPAESHVTILSSQIASGLTLTTLQSYNNTQWAAALKNIGVIPWNFQVTGVTSTSSAITVTTSGQCNNNTTGQITVTVQNPPMNVTITNVTEAPLSVQTVFGNANETIEEVYQMNETTLFNYLNKSFFQGKLATASAMTNGKINSLSLTTIYPYAPNVTTASLAIQFVYANKTCYQLTIEGFQWN